MSETTEDFLVELERMEKASLPRRVWFYRRYYVGWPWRKLKETYYKLIAFWQRGRRGWAECDTWNMDYYLAEVIAAMLAHLATHDHGTPYPFYEQKDGEHAWQTYLEELALAFHAYTAFAFSEERYEDIGNVRYQQLIERMKPFFDHYGKLGD